MHNTQFNPEMVKVNLRLVQMSDNFLGYLVLKFDKIKKFVYSLCLVTIFIEGSCHCYRNDYSWGT